MVLGTYNRVLNLAPGNATFGSANINQPICYSDMPEFQNVANANYNALEASLRANRRLLRLRDVFHPCLPYGHNLDDASGFRQRNSVVPYYSPHSYYASADSDVRHRISFSGGWDLPFNRMWAPGPRRLTSGWSLYPIVTWRTGFPFDIPAGLPDTNDPVNPGTSGRVRCFSFQCCCARSDHNARSEEKDDHQRNRLRYQRRWN